MGKLADFLQSEAEKRKAHATEIRVKREEWIEAVEALAERLKDWLEDSDKNTKVLTVSTETVTRAEEELGTYEVPELLITLDSRQVRVTPLARNVVARVVIGGVSTRPFGRVDITNGARKYILYKLVSDRWILVDPDLPATRDSDYSSVREFDRSAFESVLQELLG